MAINRRRLARPVEGVPHGLLDAVEIRNAVAVATVPRTRQHFEVRKFQTGLLVDRQRRAVVQVLERLLYVVVLKHVVAGAVAAVTCWRNWLSC